MLGSSTTINSTRDKYFVVTRQTNTKLFFVPMKLITLLLLFAFALPATPMSISTSSSGHHHLRSAWNPSDENSDSSGSSSIAPSATTGSGSGDGRGTHLPPASSGSSQDNDLSEEDISSQSTGLGKGSSHSSIESTGGISSLYYSRDDSADSDGKKSEFFLHPEVYLLDPTPGLQESPPVFYEREFWSIKSPRPRFLFYSRSSAEAVGAAAAQWNCTRIRSKDWRDFLEVEVVAAVAKTPEINMNNISAELSAESSTSAAASTSASSSSVPSPSISSEGIFVSRLYSVLLPQSEESISFCNASHLELSFAYDPEFPSLNASDEIVTVRLNASEILTVTMGDAEAIQDGSATDSISIPAVASSSIPVLVIDSAYLETTIVIRADAEESSSSSSLLSDIPMGFLNSGKTALPLLISLIGSFLGLNPTIALQTSRSALLLWILDNQDSCAEDMDVNVTTNGSGDNTTNESLTSGASSTIFNDSNFTTLEEINILRGDLFGDAEKDFTLQQIPFQHLTQARVSSSGLLSTIRSEDPEDDFLPRPGVGGNENGNYSSASSSSFLPRKRRKQSSFTAMYSGVALMNPLLVCITCILHFSAGVTALALYSGVNLKTITHGLAKVYFPALQAIVVLPLLQPTMAAVVTILTRGRQVPTEEQRSSSSGGEESLLIHYLCAAVGTLFCLLYLLFVIRVTKIGLRAGWEEYPDSGSRRRRATVIEAGGSQRETKTTKTVVVVKKLQQFFAIGVEGAGGKFIDLDYRIYEDGPNPYAEEVVVLDDDDIDEEVKLLTTRTSASGDKRIVATVHDLLLDLDQELLSKIRRQKEEEEEDRTSAGATEVIHDDDERRKGRALERPLLLADEDEEQELRPMPLTNRWHDTNFETSVELEGAAGLASTSFCEELSAQRLRLKALRQEDTKQVVSELLGEEVDLTEETISSSIIMQQRRALLLQRKKKRLLEASRLRKERPPFEHMWVRMHFLYFDRYRIEATWYAVVEVFFTLLFGVLQGWKPSVAEKEGGSGNTTTYHHCIILSSCFLLLSAILLFLCILFKPHGPLYEKVFTLGVSGLQVFASLAATATYIIMEVLADNSSSATTTRGTATIGGKSIDAALVLGNTAGWTVLLSMYILLLKAILDVVAVVWKIIEKRSAAKKKRKETERRTKIGSHDSAEAQLDMKDRSSNERNKGKGNTGYSSDGESHGDADSDDSGSTIRSLMKNGSRKRALVELNSEELRVRKESIDADDIQNSKTSVTRSVQHQGLPEEALREAQWKERLLLKSVETDERVGLWKLDSSPATNGIPTELKDKHFVPNYPLPRPENSRLPFKGVTSSASSQNKEQISFLSALEDTMIEVKADRKVFHNQETSRAFSQATNSTTGTKEEVVTYTFPQSTVEALQEAQNADVAITTKMGDPNSSNPLLVVPSSSSPTESSGGSGSIITSFTKVHRNHKAEEQAEKDRFNHKAQYAGSRYHELDLPPI